MPGVFNKRPTPWQAIKHIIVKLHYVQPLEGHITPWRSLSDAYTALVHSVAITCHIAQRTARLVSVILLRTVVRHPLGWPLNQVSLLQRSHLWMIDYQSQHSINNISVAPCSIGICNAACFGLCILQWLAWSVLYAVCWAVIILTAAFAGASLHADVRYLPKQAGKHQVTCQLQDHLPTPASRTAVYYCPAVERALTITATTASAVVVSLLHAVTATAACSSGSAAKCAIESRQTGWPPILHLSSCR